MSSQMLMLEAYEQTYGIYDHENLSEARPLSLVAMHSKENTQAFGPMMRFLRRYDELQVLKYWGLKVTELLDKPREFVEMIMKLSEERAAMEAPIINDALRKAEILNRDLNTREK